MITALVLAFTLVVAPLAGEAQAPGKTWRVAILTGAMPRSAPQVQALQKRLADLGYVDGRNLTIDFRSAGGEPDRLPALAAELVANRPDIIVAISTQSAIAVKNVTRTIPIVLGAVGDPVGSGIVPSLARPGGNITGASLLNAELSGKALQLFKEAVPAMSRVAVLWNSENPLHREVRANTESAAATLKIGLQVLDVRGAGDLPRAFDAVIRQRADGLMVLPEAVTLAHRAPILDFTAKRRLPAMYPFREMVDEGGLMCYGPNLVETYRVAAGYVDKILKGAKPGDLPIAQATKFDAIVNLKTAKALGLTIPPSLLLRADEVIQ
jgi:putative ABC transport system substrate-binding protein